MDKYEATIQSLMSDIGKYNFIELYHEENYIKEQVKAHWKAAVDALVDDALKDSTVLREKIAAELEKKFRAHNVE